MPRQPAPDGSGRCTLAPDLRVDLADWAIERPAKLGHRIARRPLIWLPEGGRDVGITRRES